MPRFTLAVLLLASPAWAGWDFSGMRFPQSRGPLETPPPRRADLSVGFTLGLNGLNAGAELRLWQAYVFAAFSFGAFAVTDKKLGVFAAGAGYSGSFALTQQGAWFCDAFVYALPGWDSRRDITTPILLGGIGLGLRYVHCSGLTVGFKVPLFGVGAQPGPESIRDFYLTSLYALPMLTVGGNLVW